MSEVRLEHRAELIPTSWLTPALAVDVLRATDLLLIVLSAVAAKLFYIDNIFGPHDDAWRYLPPAVISGIVFSLLVARQGHYEPRNIRISFSVVAMIASTLALSFLCLTAIGYAFKFGQTFSRGWAAAWFLVALAGLVVNRAVFAQIFTRLANSGAFKRRVAIVGSAEASDSLKSTLASMPDDYDYLGEFGAGGTSRSLDDLVRLGQLGIVDEVIVASPILEVTNARKVIDKLRILPVDVWVYSPEWALGVPIREVSQLGALARLKVQSRPISDRGLLLKAIEDYCLATLALILLSPLFLVIALAIKLDSRGPVFFLQKRHGFNHQIFKVWKFRTMTVMEDDGAVVQATRGDQRVTRVGKLLRMTSLDELPQLINVVLGEMSLVGPRPHAVFHNEYYSQLLDAYANRHRVKPGITGWAQIKGFRGPTDDPELMRRRVELDLYYIDHWSIWFDLKILLVTPILGFVHKNAV